MSNEMSSTPRTQKAYTLSLDDTGAVTRMEPIWDEMQALEHQLNETNKKLEETEIARWNLAGLYQAAIQSHAATRKQLETITQMKEQNQELLEAALKLVESIKPYSLSEEERALVEVIEQHRPKAKRVEGWINIYGETLHGYVWPTEELAKNFTGDDSARQVHIREVVPVEWKPWTAIRVRNHKTFQETVDAHNAEMERVTK
jgi:chromosome segregation ATPase